MYLCALIKKDTIHEHHVRKQSLPLPKISNMPTTKNALMRYKQLDRLLSDHHHYYDIHDLTDRVNAWLVHEKYKEVTQRCIEKDLVNMEVLFGAPIEHFKKNGKNCIAYDQYSFSIFTKEMSDEEENLLREVLSTIGQFDGLDNFKWLDDFKIGLGLKERRPIISFSNNPYYLSDSTLLGTLFDNISNEVVIRLSYHTFTDKTVRSIDFHPYMLKQYNDRWYLLGAADSDMKILHFALDRIDNVEPLPEKKYIECADDISERFEDIVGVTLYEDRPIEHVLCWVSDGSKGYVDSKPIHGSYTPLKGEQVLQLREKYPNLQGGMFFTIDCIPNYELIRELTSFGKDLIVLSEGRVQEDVMKRIREMMEKYSEMRT